MKPFPKPDPLTDAELDRLGDFLESCGDDAMNLEELDGFFAALIAGPESVMPSEYLPEVLGGEIGEVCEFESVKQANEIFNLLTSYWNNIAGTLYRGEVHVPMIFEDERGEFRGNDWAHGFMRGVQMRNEGWAELVHDEKHGGSLIPMMILHFEHDEDPTMRPEPITPEKREQIIALMAAGLMSAYEFFRQEREAYTEVESIPERPRTRTKIGRNDPCPCGSGKKYKKCCGRVAVQ